MLRICLKDKSIEPSILSALLVQIKGMPSTKTRIRAGIGFVGYWGQILW